MFTSGSTGTPKGVGVTQANVSRFLDLVIERYGLSEADRFSHLFELTFDLSVFDLFAAWSVGGCLCVPGPRERLLPAAYARDSALSVWFSVPSTALLMKKTRLLEPDALPGLRWSLFCGEALPVPVAEAWLDAAPNSVAENLYGPTELTLACTWHTITRDDPHASGGVVPIGEPFPGMNALVVDDDLNEVEPGQDGELLMSGPQRVPGYWRDEARTAAAFVVPPGHSEIHYRTGDLVRRPRTADEPLRFLGRVDSQIKVRGYRVELGEIEAAIRDEASVDAAVALGWSATPGGPADAIVAFVDDAEVDRSALRTRLAQRLPRYMVPREIRVVDEFPLNTNGKIDRKALAATLDG
jgi:amino acid adenylation domain-containing protein